MRIYVQGGLFRTSSKQLGESDLVSTFGKVKPVPVKEVFKGAFGLKEEEPSLNEPFSFAFEGFCLRPNSERGL